MSYVVYIIRTADNFLYTGMTWNLRKRFQEHCAGIKSFIKNRKKPFEIVYSENCSSKREAAKREKQIKGYRREKKDKLIEEFLSYN